MSDYGIYRRAHHLVEYNCIRRGVLAQRDDDVGCPRRARQYPHGHTSATVGDAFAVMAGMVTWGYAGAWERGRNERDSSMPETSCHSGRYPWPSRMPLSSTFYSTTVGFFRSWMRTSRSPSRLPSLTLDHQRYMMSLFGLNVTANNVSSATASSAHPSVTLTPSQFEDAVAQIAAQYVWAGAFPYVVRMHRPLRTTESGSCQLFTPIATLTQLVQVS